MRRFTVSLSVIVIVLLGSVVAWGSGTSAQEPFATPRPGEFELVPGQIGRSLAGGLVPEPPAGPVYFGLLHITVARGGQRADSRHAGALYHGPVGRPAALR